MQPAFHKFEDQLRTRDVNEQKRNHLRDAEGGLDPHGISDPYAPYRVPTDELSAGPWNEVYRDAYNTSNQALPLVANATPFQRSDLYDDIAGLRGQPEPDVGREPERPHKKGDDL